MDKQERIEEIREIFEEAKTEDNWNTDEDMLYSFYFVDTDPDKLEELGNELAEQDFIFVDVFQLGDEETGDATGEYMLHIDKIGVYNPESLAEQIETFRSHTDKHGLAELDGWEFGEVGEEDEEDESEEEEE